MHFRHQNQHRKQYMFTTAYVGDNSLFLSFISHLFQVHSIKIKMKKVEFLVSNLNWLHLRYTKDRQYISANKSFTLAPLLTHCFQGLTLSMLVTPKFCLALRWNLIPEKLQSANVYGNL